MFFSLFLEVGSIQVSSIVFVCGLGCWESTNKNSSFHRVHPRPDMSLQSEWGDSREIALLWAPLVATCPAPRSRVILSKNLPSVWMDHGWLWMSQANHLIPTTITTNLKLDVVPALSPPTFVTPNTFLLTSLARPHHTGADRCHPLHITKIANICQVSAMYAELHR